MKYTLTLAFAFGLVLTSAAAADGDFVRVREAMRAQLETRQPDGTIRMSKQFRRWEWFWEARQTSTGDFKPPAHYINEAARVNNRKREADVQAAPTWVELGPTGPSGVSLSGGWNGIGRVNMVEISRTNPDLMFLGSAQGGIWKTTDAGSNWNAINVPILPMFGVSDIAIAPSNASVIYVATGDADAAIPGVESNLPGFTYGIIKSVDGGATWTLTGFSKQPSSNDLVARLWVDPRDANVVVACTYTGIRRTSDGGNTWTQVSNSLFFRDLVGNVDDPDILHAATSSRSGGSAIYRSVDNGKTWSLVQSFASSQRIRLAVSKANPNLVMALSARPPDDNGMDGIYRSTDKGATYSKLSIGQNLLGWSASGQGAGGQGQYDLAFEISPSNANALFVGGINIWRSTNQGSAWFLSAHNNGQGAPWVHADIHYLKGHPSRNVVYACHDGGIARTTDNGVSWTDISRGLKIQQYYALSTSNVNTNITLAGAQDNSTMLSTNGTSFVHVLGGDGMDNAIDPVNPSIIYASSQYGDFAVSMNTGFNWDYIASRSSLGEPGASWVTPIVTHPTTSGTVFVGYTQVHKSTNYGNSWMQLTNFPATAVLRHLAVAKSDPNYIYAGFSSTVQYTTNGGASWQAQNGVGAGYIQDVQVHPTNPRRWWVTYGGFDETKIIEVNNGVITNITGAGLPDVPCNAVLFQPGTPGRLYVGTDVGVFFKDEGTSSWAPFGNGMPTTIVTDMEFITPTNKLRVATYGRGVWEVTAQICSATQPQVEAMGPVTVCAGDTVRLQASDGFSKYIWSNGATSRNISLGGITESGTYTVNVIDANGCTSVSQPITVTIKRSPVKPSISRRGGDTIRSTAIGGITIFQWYAGDVAIDGATSREFVPSQNGVYSVVVTNAEGCSTRSEPHAFTSATTAVADEVMPSFRLYPNPASDEVHIDLPGASDRTIEVVNVTGSVVYSTTAGDEQLTLTLPLASIPAGTYYVRIRSGAASWMQRFVHQ